MDPVETKMPVLCPPARLGLVAAIVWLPDGKQGLYFSSVELGASPFGSLQGPGEGVMGPVALLQDPFEDEKLVSPIKVPPTHSQRVFR